MMNTNFTKPILFGIIAVLFSLSSLFAQTYSWTQLNDFGGTVRFGVVTFVIGNYGYFGGGYANGVSHNDIWQYNPGNDSWTQMSNCPIALRASGNFALNGKGYLVCGLVGGSTIKKEVLEYDPSTNVWTAKADFPGVKVYGAASFAINGKGYFGVGNGGGANGPYYTAFYEYDPINDSWTLKAPFPGSPRYGTFGLAINNKGYVGLGSNDGLNILYTDWYQYDPITNVWTQKAFFAGAGRNYTSGFVIGNNGFVVCGGTIPVLENDFYKYDAIANAWTVLPDFGGMGRFAGQSFAIGDTGYTGTGLNGANYLRDFWKYAPDSSTSIQENLLNDFSIFPNPCQNMLTLSGSHFASLMSIEVINIESKLIYSEKFTTGPSSSHKIDVSQLSTGMYFVKLNFANRSYVKKIYKI